MQGVVLVAGPDGGCGGSGDWHVYYVLAVPAGDEGGLSQELGNVGDEEDFEGGE